MNTKGIIDEDFINYKKPSMFINTCFCSFKCDMESGKKCCQNAPLVQEPTIEIDDDAIIQRYLKNDITQAIVIGGLEPFDSFDELAVFIDKLNTHGVSDDLVIYTGYREDELIAYIVCLIESCSPYRDLIIKYGRYIPDSTAIIDPVLGVRLSSDNQYARIYAKRGVSA